MTSPASTDIRFRQASAHIQMSQASLDKRQSDPIICIHWLAAAICNCMFWLCVWPANLPLMIRDPS